MYFYFINKLSYKIFLYISFLISFICVISSYIFQYYMNLEPCEICLYQRYLWIVLFLTTLIYIFLLDQFKFIKLISLLFIILLIFGISLYHSLLELGLIKNIFSCSQGIDSNISTLQELDKLIRNTKNTDCSFSKYTIIGLTLANISLLLTTILLFLNLKILKNKLSKKYG